MTWRERRVADLAELVNGHPFESADFADEGAVPLVRIRDILSKPFQTFVSREVVPEAAVVRDGDVVVGMDGDFNLVYWTRGPAALNQRLCLLRSNGQADTRFLAYALPSHLKVINDLTYSTTVKHLASGQVRGIKMLAPDVSEQRAIADYLDRETARIDALIEEQQRLIKMLELRKRAVLDEVTTAAEGERIRLKYLFAPSSDSNHPEEQVLSVYRDFGVIQKSSRSDNFNRTPENVERYLLVQPGDVVINRMKAWQGSLGVSDHRGIVSGVYEVIRPTNSRLRPKFAHLYLRSPRLIAEYALRSKGIRPSQWRLYWDEMGNIEIPVPSPENQDSIVERAEKQIAHIDSLIAETERFIELARERRSALITAAVTGQIDVRAAA